MYQVGAAVSRLQIQLASEQGQQVQEGAGRPVQIKDLVQIGVEVAQQGTGGGGFAGPDLASKQTHAAVIDEKL